jgi:four helix bundle protein
MMNKEIAMSEPQPLKTRTKQYALSIIGQVGSLPQSMVAQTLGKQLLRSGTSVGANYREGSGARSDAEMIAKFGICIQELEESAYWLELLQEAKLVTEDLNAPLLDETNQLTAIFVASVKRLAKNQKSR